MKLAGLWVVHAHESGGPEQEISFAVSAPSVEVATQRARVILRKTHPGTSPLIISLQALPSGVWLPEPADFEGTVPEPDPDADKKVLKGRFS